MLIINGPTLQHKWSITPHFPICFNSPANPEDVIGVLLVLLTLQGFTSHHATMPPCHHDAQQLSLHFCQDTFIKPPTQPPPLQCGIRLDPDLLDEVGQGDR